MVPTGIQSPVIIYPGKYGAHCPEESKKTKPALPTCFSGTNTVEVEGRGITTIDSLQIGDHVKSGMTLDGQSQYSRFIS
jgi:hypothetical protein